MHDSCLSSGIDIPHFEEALVQDEHRGPGELRARERENHFVKVWRRKRVPRVIDGRHTVSDNNWLQFVPLQERQRLVFSDFRTYIA
jgi:hypothetical protein